MIINLGCASVDNHIPWDEIFPIRECNIYIISMGAQAISSKYFFSLKIFFFLANIVDLKEMPHLAAKHL